MGSMEKVGDEIQPRGYWRWSKQDFLPEESFKNWSSYRSALSQTWFRFKDRLRSRSDDAKEVGEMRKQSENDMKRCLTWWDLTWFGFGSVIGAGIFVLTGQEAHEHAGPAIVLSYVASGVSALLSVFCYTEFAVEIPVAGGSFAYLRIELGDFAAFITAGNILLESIVGSAAVARAWTSYFTTLLNRPTNSLRIHTNLTKGYNQLDPIAVAVLAIAATLAMISTRKTSVFNWIASAINTVVILFVIIAGFANANPSNLTPFLPFGVKGIFQAAAIVYFAYGGFDNIATMAGSSGCLEGDDHSSSGRGTWTSEVCYSYRMSPHDPSVVCSGAPKNWNPNKCYTLDCHFKCPHRFLFKLGCLVNLVISEYTLHLHDDGSGASCEEILCDRGYSTYQPLETSNFLADNCCFLHGDFSLLGTESQWLGWLCNHHSSLAPRHCRDCSVSTPAEDAKGLGGSTSSMASILVDCYKSLSHGISGVHGFHKIRCLHHFNAGLLCLLWSPCNI